MKTISIPVLTICGIEELPSHGPRSVTHVLSIIDPETPDPDAFNDYTAHEKTVLRFHDTIDERPGLVPPTPGHVEEILHFGSSLHATREDRKDGHLLVHCHMGVSRSTAAMVTLLAQANPTEDEDSLFLRLAVIRPQAWPNSRMIGFADTLLGRNGRLAAALTRHYGRRLQEDAAVEGWIRNLGRGREVEMAVLT